MLVHMGHEVLARAHLASQACPCLVLQTLWVDLGGFQRRGSSLVMAPVRPQKPRQETCCYHVLPPLYLFCCYCAYALNMTT